MEQKDYYKILGVEKTADGKAIKNAYRELALKYHPDRNQDNPEAIERMKLVNEAYAVLSNENKRRQYDTMRSQYGSQAYSRFRNAYSEQDIFHGSDIFSVFEEIARGFGLRGHEEIFKEFYGSGYKKFEYQQPGGGLFVKGFIFTGPFGKKKEQKPQLEQPGPMGKLSRYVLKKLTGATFPQEGADITDQIRVSSQQARQGGPYPYFHKKRDKKLVLKIPPGVKEGQRIRLAGMGEEGKDGGKPGDLYLSIHIQKPLKEKVKDLLTNFGLGQKG